MGGHQLDKINCSNFHPNITTTPKDIHHMTNQVIQGHWGNISLQFSDWHKSQLDAELGEPGVHCLLSNWLCNDQKEPGKGIYCNATWKYSYCWSTSPSGTIITTDYGVDTDDFHSTHLPTTNYSHNMVGSCTDNGTWIWCDMNNCGDCIIPPMNYDWTRWDTGISTTTVGTRQILFIGSLLSILSLVAALSTHIYFKRIWCDKITVQVNLMLAFLLRSVTIIIVTGSSLFSKTDHNMAVDLACKFLFSIDLYAIVASTFWIILQGVYLWRRLTQMVIADEGTPFKWYYLIGWGIPVGLTAFDVGKVEVSRKSDKAWILLPVLFVVIATVFVVLDVFRILLKLTYRSIKRGSRNPYRHFSHFRKTRILGTIFLLPLLGINNLLHLDPGWGRHLGWLPDLKTLLNSTQGVLIPFLFCFMTHDVKEAVREEFQRRRVYDF